MKKILLLMIIILFPILSFSATQEELENTYLRNGMRAYKAYQFDSAISYFSQAIDINPENPKAYFFRGKSYLFKKKYNEALDDFNDFLQRNSRNPVGYYYRGLTYYHLKRYDDALKDLNIAIEKNPKFIEAFFSRGLTYLRLEKYKESISDFSEFISYRPSDRPLVYFYRASAYETINEKDKAIEDYRKFIKLSQKQKLKEEAQRRIQELSK